MDMFKKEIKTEKGHKKILIFFIIFFPRYFELCLLVQKVNS